MREVITEGIRGIVFKKLITEVELEAPPDFKIKKSIIEYRQDPFTDLWVRISVERAMRPRQVPLTPPEVESWKRKDYDEKCPFCTVERSTPKYPPHILEEGRLIEKSQYLFPNLYPFAKYHAVVTLTPKHFKEYQELTTEEWYHALHLSIEYFRKISTRDREVRYFTINLNYLAPAGASILHPHLQLVADVKLGNYTALLLQKYREYRSKWGTDLIQDLVESEEKLGERFLWRGKLVTWIVAYAPWIPGEIIGTAQVSDIRELSDSEVRYLAEDIKNLLNPYRQAVKTDSINVSMYSLPGTDLPLLIRIGARKPLQPYYTNDRGFMEVLHQEPITDILPENLTKTLRELRKQ
ncbi:MAG: hypothetical protein DRJ40_05065 [Thermoprotei archaeon]|nr:MAG: hypothetical protein DRJ40_04460 [Thermoprotei archaeon]RLE56769.1 MAG: hypothetical protein DRJ40_05065 [Thermoprotei archaeon]